ncbi:hypothetical protein PPTG_14156 [Phytophthora nicotianae INRA-310]|uniref:Uncharacterized protein n=1 Tax=Phytophthora nicotianae (strain INRA-310) TaxID=761204 RepID=W2PXQ4_PHYN3|nr:hypothetical protein PPTG_14156 [Phytophthora nicotianae INRA-310]ETN05416.1 hypothetical protein PPTG_14156 [Phytophthora nicotianae INRA-310]
MVFLYLFSSDSSCRFECCVQLVMFAGGMAMRGLPSRHLVPSTIHSGCVIK